MSLFYVTGISGSGKSAVLTELRKRGYSARGTDEDGVAQFVDRNTGEIVIRPEQPELRTPEWRAKTAWKIQRGKVEELADKAKDRAIFLCGAAEGDNEVWDLFTKVFALAVDEQTLRHRVSTRKNNNFGQNPHEFELIMDWQKKAEADYRNLGAIIIDATRPVVEVVDEIVRTSIDE